MSVRDELIKAVKEGEPAEDACKRLKVPKYIAFTWLKRSGIEDVKADLEMLGSERQRIGVFGEKEFRKLVPSAKGVNQTDGGSHPDYDFELAGLTIDVKTATVNKTGSWYIPAGDAAACDLFCVFLVARDLSYKIMLFSPGIWDRRRLYAGPDNIDERFGDYMVQPGELESAIRRCGAE